MNGPAQRLKHQLEALGRQFQEELPLRLAELREALPLVAEGDREAIHQLQRSARLLAEAASLFGQVPLAKAADSLLHVMDMPLAGVDPLSSALAEVEARVAEGLSPLPDGHAQTHCLFALMSPSSGFLPPADHLATFGLQVALYRNVTDLLEALKEAPPIAMVLEGSCLDSADWEALTEVQTRLPRPVPSLVVSDQTDMQTRLRALRAGGIAFLALPVDPLSLLEALDPFLPGQDPDPYRILAVVEDPLQGAWLRAVLEQDGMHVDTCFGPSALLEALSDVRPDLLVLPSQLQDCTGAELTALVRQHNASSSLPALFLEHGNGTAPCPGWDETLVLPVPPDLLTTTVRARARRGRTLKGLLLKDPLTGVLNHTAFLETLRGEMARSIRRGSPLALGLLDLDHVRAINERHGHEAGDHAIRSLARLLQQRLRRTDIIGRYGGEALAVVLPDTPLEGARTAVEDIRQRFRQIRFPFPAGEASLSFSAGIASCPPFLEPDIVVLAADNGLDMAKRGGRDRVEVVDPR